AGTPHTTFARRPGRRRPAFELLRGTESHRQGTREPPPCLRNQPVRFRLMSPQNSLKLSIRARCSGNKRFPLPCPVQKVPTRPAAIPTPAFPTTAWNSSATMRGFCSSVPEQRPGNLRFSLGCLSISTEYAAIPFPKLWPEAAIVDACLRSSAVERWQQFY